MDPNTHIALLVFLVGGLMVISLLAKAGCRRIGIPALVAYLILGVLLRSAENSFRILGTEGKDVMEFLGTLGVIALLFRVGLESNLPGLLHQLRRAIFIWFGDILVSGSAGFIVARYVLSLDLVPSMVIATALTATSVGIPARIWQDADAINTSAGQRFLDVAELDDISGVLLMSLLFAVLPIFKKYQTSDLGLAVVHQLGMFVILLAGLIGLCALFSRYLEKRFTAFIRRIEAAPDPMLIVVGVGLLVAAVAGLVGFSIAIGAFLAGLVFSRDPKHVKVNASFSPLYDLFTPFFFIGIGFAMEPGFVFSSLGVGGFLFLAAVAGKLIGPTTPALAFTNWRQAGTLGVSMVPRAEIAMLIMHRASKLEPAVISSSVYGGMVFVCAGTCLATSLILPHLVRNSRA